jgi:predicted RND superfamily exporter protein
MFWKNTASFILKNRLLVLIGIVALSVFMSYKASQVKITFNGGKVLPVTDSAYIRYNQFKKMFGQDASSMVIGIKSDKIFNKDIFNDWYQIGTSLKQVKGVKAVISVANVYNLKKDTNQHKLYYKTAGYRRALPTVTGG